MKPTKKQIDVTGKLLLSDQEAAHVIGCARSTFRQRVRAGIYPQQVKDCGGTRWKRSDLESYVNSLEAV